MKEVKIEACHFCGGTKFVNGRQFGHGMIHSGFLNGQPLYHIICADCGSVVRSFVANTDGMRLYEEK